MAIPGMLAVTLTSYRRRLGLSSGGGSKPPRGPRGDWWVLIGLGLVGLTAVGALVWMFIEALGG